MEEEIVKFYADRNITIYAPKSVLEVGNEADVADSCLDAAYLLAEQFTEHMKYEKDKEKFWKSFRKRAGTKEIVTPLTT